MSSSRLNGNAIPDIGVKYNCKWTSTDCINSRFCGAGYNNRLVFLELASDTSQAHIIYIDNYLKSDERIPVANAVYVLEITAESKYFLCSNPVIVYETTNGKIMANSKALCNEEAIPLCLAYNQENVFVSLSTSKLIILNRRTLTITNIVDLSLWGIKYPLYITAKDSCDLLICDYYSSVFLISVDGKLKGTYNGGITQDLSPQWVCCTNNKSILISSDRMHCVIEVSTTNMLIRLLGVPYSVGNDGVRLWSPFCLYLKDNIVAVMICGSISIVTYHEKMQKWIPYWGQSILHNSQLCHPRSCDYSKKYKLIMVCDTEHNRVILYHMYGKLYKVINGSQIPGLQRPRCAMFNGNKLIISESVRRFIHVVTIGGKLLESYEFNSTIANGQWLQSIDYAHGKMLVAFESEVILMEWSSKLILWSTREYNINLNDIHYAQYLGGKRFLIADNGNHRGVLVRKANVTFITSLNYRHNDIKLISPRFMRVIRNRLYVLDSNRGIIYKCRLFSRRIAAYCDGSDAYHEIKLVAPRWFCIGPQHSLIISDTENHRVITRHYKSVHWLSK